MTEPIRVLWVDPDEQIMAQCAPLMHRMGWIVCHARTVLDAMELVAGSAFHFAVIELRLPDGIGTDAWHLFRRLRPDMKGIFTTASPSLRALISVSGPGIIGYLLKPNELDTVCNLIDQAIQN